MTRIWAAAMRVGAAGLGCVALHEIGLSVLLPIAACLAVATLLPIEIPIGIRLVVGAPVVVCIALISTAMLQGIGASLEPVATWAPVIAVAVGFRKTESPKFRTWLSGARVIAALPLVAAVLAGGFLMSAGTHPGNGQARSLTQRVSLLAASEDAASHLAIYDTVYEAGGYPYREADRMRSAQWPYPPAFHIMANLVRASFDDTLGTNVARGGRLDALWISGILAVALMVGAAVSVLSSIALRNGSGLISSLGAACATTILLISWAPFSMFVHGYFPQIMAIGLFLAGVSAAVWTDRIGARTTAILQASAVVSVAWTWFFILPLAALVAVAAAARVRRPGPARREIISSALLAISLSAVPISVSLSNTERGVLNAEGGGAPLTMSTVLAPLVLAIGLLALARAQSGRDAGRTVVFPLMLVATSSLAFAITIRQYQLATAGVTAYFFEKALLICCVVGAVTVAVGILVTGTVSAGAKHRAISTAGIWIALLGVILSTDARPNLRHANGMWMYRDGRITNSLAGLMPHLTATNSGIQGRYIVTWQYTGEALADYNISRWMNALNRRSEERLFDFYRDSVTDQEYKDLVSFIEDVEGEVVIISNDGALRVNLSAAGLDPSLLERVEVNPWA